MQERQESWTRSALASTSPMSAESSPESSPHHRPGYLKQASGSSASGSGGATTLASKSRPRKKVAKACLACQKSHLTCDEKRPCTRCVKKGIGEQCVEGVRKKAKYLLEGDERLHPPPPQQPHAQQPTQVKLEQSPLMPSLPPLMPDNPNNGVPNRVSDDVWLAAPMPAMEGDVLESRQIWGTDQPVPPTESENRVINPYVGPTAAADEFQMLDAMFGSMSPVFPFDTTPSSSKDDPFGISLNQTQSNDSFPVGQWTGDDVGGNGPATNTSGLISQDAAKSGFAGSFDNIWNAPVNGQNGSSSTSRGQSSDTASVQPPQPIGDGPFVMVNPTYAGDYPPRVNRATPSEVYHSVNKPYDYTEGYHALMQYLTANYGQKDVLRVVRSLAAYRPSLIALQMPMSEEDEVFLERSFQRTLIELEKLISYSATPTAVWRRTGEVCYANPEFCRLVGKTEGELFGKRSYIYHLFAKPSVIAYWENFSVHAFENTTQNYYQPTGVERDGQEIRCSVCYTIRRDVFDLPSVVIGQFLPVPLDVQ